MDSTPRFFIVRNPGPPGTVVHETQPGKQSSIVPLIPADILPPWVKIEGYPRVLSIEQTAGMTSLGGFPPEEGHVRVQLFDLPLARGHVLSGEQHAAPQAGAPPQDNHVIDTPMSNAAVPTKPSEKRHKEHGPRGFSTGSRTSENSKLHRRQKVGNYPPPRQSSMRANIYGHGKGIFERTQKLGFCQEWCHHGVCKRGFKCSLSHKMPKSAGELKAIGLDKFPRWWRERHRGLGMKGPRELMGRSSNPMEMKQEAAPLPVAGTMTGGTLPPAAGLQPQEGLAPAAFNQKLGAQKDEELLVKF
ncbi:unnamed protein product [Clonostachys solani]|uniref:C3H1-type domain-containing protein n=1 Tax=Clonostachys solani TaxID=160281 RepID=A0A9P0EHP9_9HYPO|nr:unnamed protein product [Clonostachys solani]